MLGEIACLSSLVEAGHTVIVIEHHLDDGGEIVVTGTPGEVAACKDSYTGRYLQERLRR